MLMRAGLQAPSRRGLIGGSAAMAAMAALPGHAATPAGAGPASAYADGHQNASTGPIQYPTLLSGYRFRPPWRVVGVDFAAGPRAGVRYKVPGVDKPPAGVNPAHKVFYIGAPNTVLDGWDFSGWSVWQGNGVGNTTIQNCRFAVGANGLQMFKSPGSAGGGGTIQYCTFDGANGANISDGGEGQVNIFSSGTWKLYYNWFRNAVADIIDFCPTGHATLDARFNIFDNNGAGSPRGWHPDVIQSYTPAAVTIGLNCSWNLWMQTANGAWFTRGVTAGDESETKPTFTAFTVNNNTMAFPVTPRGGNGGLNPIFGGDTSQWDGAIGRFQNNYVDATDVSLPLISVRNGRGGRFASKPGAYVESGNINMRTGAAIS